MTSASPRPATPAGLSRSVALVLAGGRGSRMHDLTDRESKPALHVAALHRIVDFPIAAAARAGLGQVIVSTGHCPGTLARHLARVWAPAFPGGLVVCDGPQRTADALLALAGADEVVILPGDQVHDLDLRPLIAHHRAAGAAVTALAGSPSGPTGIHAVSGPWLRALLRRNPAAPENIARHILSAAAADGPPAVRPPDAAYWRDIDTLDDLRRAALDFERPVPPCLRPLVPGIAPRNLPDVAAPRSRFGAQLTLGGIRLLSPLLHPAQRSRWTVLDRSVLMPGARVATGVRLTRCIVACGTAIPDGLAVGEDPAEDSRWFRVTPEGTTLVTTAMLARRAADRPLLHAVMLPRGIGPRRTAVRPVGPTR
ncbi:MAG: NTP transferase domain-containing protein [Paracoccaceae bacterium]|nr:MAG: NTP transferase domain-containing protein [Paracoccaceae bacterium]